MVFSIEPNRVRKGQLKMRGLVEEIHGFAWACQQVEGSVVPSSETGGAFVDLEDLDSVINALDRPLVTIRFLAHEVFEKSDRHGFEKTKNTTLGRVVKAMTPPRNYALHAMDVIDPDVSRAVNLPDGRFVIFPRWKKSADVPAEMFHEMDSKKKKSRHRPKLAETYDDGLGGRKILDTLLDAFQYFDTTAPALAERDEHGHVKGFPLPPLPVAGGYYRQGPDWPSSEERDADIRRRATTVRPAGLRREITGRLVVNGTLVFCGWTHVDASRRAHFIESIDQVTADIKLGFPYDATIAAQSSQISVEGEEATSDGVRLADLPIPDASTAMEPWEAWQQLVDDDAHEYRQQRLVP